jgi:hypothetical protein
VPLSGAKLNAEGRLQEVLRSRLSNAILLSRLHVESLRLQAATSASICEIFVQRNARRFMTVSPWLRRRRVNLETAISSVYARRHHERRRFFGRMILRFEIDCKVILDWCLC